MKLILLRNQLKDTFSQSGIDSIEADFVTAHTLGVPVTNLALIDEVTLEQEKAVRRLACKRLKHIPLDVLLGEREFYGLNFKVNRHVLTPRADSELLVDEAIKLLQAQECKSVLDLCTGSGCLAVAVAKNHNVKMTASDISRKALKLARCNAQQNAVTIKFVKSDMFSKICDSFDLIISNPPYIASRVIKTLDKEVQKYDPRLALDGGEDGLKFYREIAKHCNQHLNPNGVLILEIGDEQAASVKDIFADYEYVNLVQDYGQHDRVLIFRKKEAL